MCSHRSVDCKAGRLKKKMPIHSFPMTMLWDYEMAYVNFNLWTIQTNKSKFIRNVIVNKAGKKL